MREFLRFHQRILALVSLTGLLRHKTKHLSFRLGVPAVLGMQVFLLFLIAQ